MTRSRASNPGKRFVEQQQPRLWRQRPGQGDPLLLAAGKGVGKGVEVGAHADLAQDLFRPMPLPVAGLANQPEAHIVQDGQMGKQGIVLEDEPDTAAFRGQRNTAVGHHFPCHGNPASLEIFKPGCNTQQRRFPTSGRSDEADDLTNGDGEADGVDRDRSGGTGG